MFGHIFIATDSDNQPLEDFARRLFSRLGVARFEERESSNYVDGQYFRSIALGIEIEVAYADEQGPRIIGFGFQCSQSLQVFQMGIIFIIMPTRWHSCCRSMVGVALCQMISAKQETRTRDEFILTD